MDFPGFSFFKSFYWGLPAKMESLVALSNIYLQWNEFSNLVLRIKIEKIIKGEKNN